MSWRLSVDDSTEPGDAPGGGGWAAASPFGGGLASLRSMTRVAADAGKAAAQRGRAALNEDGLRGVAAKVAQKTTAVAREGLQTALERAAEAVIDYEGEEGEEEGEGGYDGDGLGAVGLAGGGVGLAGRGVGSGGTAAELEALQARVRELEQANAALCAGRTVSPARPDECGAASPPRVLPEPPRLSTPVGRPPS